MDTRDFDAITLDQLRAGGGLKWSAFPDCIGAFVAEMDFGTAPAVREALRDAIARDRLGYLSAEPLRAMAQACARWQRDHHGWDIAASSIKAMPDVLGALEAVLRHCLPAGAPVALPVPCYMPFLPLLEWLGNPVVQVPMHREGQAWRLDEEALDAAFAGGARMLLLCNPHNPIGKVYTRGELLRIAAIAGRHDARVFSDEIHAPLVYAGQRHVPYASVSEPAAHQAITAVSASKTWNLAGLKCAQLVFTRADDLQAWRRIGGFAGGATSTLGVIAHAAAWGEGETWRRQVLDYLQGNRDLLGRLLRERLPRIGYLPPQGTYLAWLDCRALPLPMAPHLFFRRQARVALTDGGECGQGGEGHVRLNFAMPRPLLAEAVERMATAVAAL
ncbi:MalY/PatB family protein [Pseudoxanthomonas broegbernensis]|uniref:MalY/PatB family protein n=1 Tax=Pseudoxanthomonas broegbernensis TaxID=83619 RepID=UPI001838AD7C|nr:aminotransferase class I/II-fold pyridoxal phosphate-dependent enzyme [Pseudoxanthomonas broegbernensis]MBB6063696.1 cystathionine beta-lyase [Pseudoxanthomonas broegbernensis]